MMGNYMEKISKDDIVCKSQVSALSECADLLDNGYIYMFSHVEPNRWYFKFRHRCNGRTIKVVWSDDRYQVIEGDKVLKSSDC